MKKRIVMIFACTLAAMTILSGCGKMGSDHTGDGSLSASEETADVEISNKTLLAATDYDVKDYVKLMKNYMGMDVTLTSDYTVTDDAVKEYIENYIISYYPQHTETDKTTVESGDTVNIDFVGKLDGEAFDGGTAQGYLLEIGSGSFIDGFEDGLIGKNVGETCDLNLTFPENYSAENLAGQDVVFTVTINSIVEEKTITYDELSDEYVAENFASYGMNTVDDLNANVRSQLESNYESDRQYDIQTEVVNRLKEESEVTLPDGLLEERIQKTIDSIKEQAEEAGMEYEEYVTTYYGQSVEELERDIQETLESQLIQKLILEAIVADQKMSVTQGAVDTFVSNYLSGYGYEDADAFYADNGGKEYFQLIFAEGQALNTVKNAANVIEAEDSAENSEENSQEDIAE